MLRAPIKKILPSFIPSIFEKGVPGYEAMQGVQGEKRLSRSDVRSLYLATAYLGTLEHVANKDFEMERVRPILTQSVSDLSEVTADEKALAFQLIERFYNFNTIRADHPFDDWVCDALWTQFQDIPYVYPSAMSAAVSYGLAINHTLSNCAVEY